MIDLRLKGCGVEHALGGFSKSVTARGSGKGVSSQVQLHFYDRDQRHHASLDKKALRFIIRRASSFLKDFSARRLSHLGASLGDCLFRSSEIYDGRV